MQQMPQMPRAPGRIAAEAVRIHPVRTPEGVSLPFRVAPAGDRVKAFLLDLLVISAGSLAVWVLAFLTLPSSAAALGISLALLASFLLRNFYFIFWEVNRGGVTLGKRASGLRVISRDGGPLTAEAVFARNLTRDVEFFIPLLVFLAPQALIPDAPPWAGYIAGAWLFLFAAMPLFNKDRLRCGDLVAGTLVVQAPVPVLLPDLALPERPFLRPRREAAALPAAPAAPPGLAFTREQLDIYGIHELQVLEDLLRRFADGTLEAGVLDEVSARIRTKIGWPAEPKVPVLEFLQAFYAAQRGRLENKLLFGQRQERKRGS
jgi:uncharacterized RDD family membrane protein YckC